MSLINYTLSHLGFFADYDKEEIQERVENKLKEINEAENPQDVLKTYADVLPNELGQIAFAIGTDIVSIPAFFIFHMTIL